MWYESQVYVEGGFYRMFLRRWYWYLAHMNEVGDVKFTSDSFLLDEVNQLTHQWSRYGVIGERFVPERKLAK